MDRLKMMKLYEKMLIPVLIIMLLIIIPMAVILGIIMFSEDTSISSMTEVTDLFLGTINSFLPFMVVILFGLSLAYMVYQIID